jgi:hypothetical protein
MDDKAGLVLWAETVINHPEEFRARRQVLRDGKQRIEWVALRKGVAYLARYREISLQEGARSFDALARWWSMVGLGFNPLAQLDANLY